MAGIESWLKGFVFRALPSANPDQNPAIARLGRYGDLHTIGIVRKQHALVDEGSYFVANNGSTGITGQAIATAVAASPTILIANSDSSGNPNPKRLHLDYADLIVTTAGSAASALARVALAVVLDTGDRYVSGGTDISSLIVNPNMDVPARASVAKVRVGALVAAAATGAARTVIGQRTLKLTVSATVLDVVDTAYHLNFGGVESAAHAFQVSSAAGVQTNALNVPVKLPPITIGPGQCVLIYLYYPAGATIVAPAYLPELAWWER